MDGERRQVAALAARWGMTRAEVLALPAWEVERVLLVLEAQPAPVSSEDAGWTPPPGVDEVPAEFAADLIGGMAVEA